MQLKSILTNFGFHAMSGREMDEELLSLDVRSNQNDFYLNDVINIITKKW
jgi:bifunctional N-acetylglucosamine-1-phosphate-uridyltransferase/glucosamine-1-phosphate-acetyltransferase GlmU-like protein